MHEVLHDTALYELRAPSVSAWTCGEQAAHILLAARSMAHTIEGNLTDPQRGRTGEWVGYAGGILERGVFPRGRARSPEPLDPTGRTRDELVELAPGIEGRWEAIGSRLDEVRACPARSAHFALGWLSSSEWVRFCAIHTAHHLAIVRDIGGLPTPR